VVCFGVPAAVLAGSFVWLAVDHGTPRIWSVVVHESGRYTLRDTILYFAHFLREIPTAVAYTLFLVGVSARADPGVHMPRDRAHTLGVGALLLALALVGTALVMTSRADGWTSALQDLLQYRTRDDLVGFGTHWRYHWLSTLWFGAGIGVAPALAAWLFGDSVLRASPRWMIAAWGYFLLPTLVFGLSGDIFTDVRYVGHQAREILTHGPVTALPAVGLLLALGSPRGSGASTARHPLSWIAGIAFLLIPVYLAAVGVAGGALAEGQTGQGLAAMVAAHYFEHTLDYVLVFLLLVASLGLKRPGDPSSPH
jgi:hypothetical protein